MGLSKGGEPWVVGRRAKGWFRSLRGLSKAGFHPQGKAWRLSFSFDIRKMKGSRLVSSREAKAMETDHTPTTRHGLCVWYALTSKWLGGEGVVFTFLQKWCWTQGCLQPKHMLFAQDMLILVGVDQLEPVENRQDSLVAEWDEGMRTLCNWHIDIK